MEGIVAIDWGDVPTWIGAITTGGSAVFAARTYILNNRRLIRQQAARVRIIVEQLEPRPGQHGMRYRAAVINGSDAYITIRSISVSAFGDVDFDMIGTNQLGPHGEISFETKPMVVKGGEAKDPSY